MRAYSQGHRIPCRPKIPPATQVALARSWLFPTAGGQILGCIFVSFSTAFPSRPRIRASVELFGHGSAFRFRELR